MDGVARGDIPEKFIDIATKIDKLNLRSMFHTHDTNRMIEEIVRELYGKARLVDDIHGAKKEKRVKREDVDLSTLCPDHSCIGLLKQYEQWRQEHGYAYYTGVWKVGK